MVRISNSVLLYYVGPKVSDVLLPRMLFRYFIVLVEGKILIASPIKKHVVFKAFKILRSLLKIREF